MSIDLGRIFDGFLISFRKLVSGMDSYRFLACERKRSLVNSWSRSRRMTAEVEKPNITANWRAAAPPRIAALHDADGRTALPGTTGHTHRA